MNFTSPLHKASASWLALLGGVLCLLGSVALASPQAQNGAVASSANTVTSSATSNRSNTRALSKKATAVLIDKSARSLKLLNDGHTLREYRISLGKKPKGHKLYEGDQRTPEGRYVLDWRNSNSKFYRSIHVSYPNARDRARARKLGKPAGGNIMIHGIPNNFSYAPWLYTGKDWTDGCISVTNAQMDEIWAMVDDGTPIVILP